MIFDVSASASRSDPRFLPWRMAVLSIVFLNASITNSSGSPPPNETITFLVQQENQRDYYADAHPYLEESLDKLGKRIPELRKIHPAGDLQELPAILKKTASNVDSLFRDIVDVIAQEKITQERLSSGGGYR